MNSIIRNLDELSRIVLPKQMLEQIGVSNPAENHVTLELTVKDDAIVLRRTQNRCCLCSSTQNTRKFKDAYLCEDCIAAIRSARE